ncbi:alanine racemase [Bacillus shivajii]|uniref:alanine racemase n=1 Tax=Bacillus shivajii TaxID=1983719 RepID=UPI001CFA8968|nr:alanine racemase [Bacillus shivajii]UCZ51524.1 alanine racemase [Bacillus shivajii]
MSRVSYRQTWVEVSLDAIYQNAQTFKRNLSERTKFMAVVKADGYGHGAVEVAKTAIAAGADALGVAFLDEALVLRKANIKVPILVLGYTPPESCEDAVLNQITITVFSDDVVDELAHVTEKLNTRASVHLKVDTGMARVGVTSKEAAFSLAKKISILKNVELEGIFTHFANADSIDSTYTNTQFDKFKEVYQYLEKNNIRIPIKHCCNSAATMSGRKYHLDMVRVGISLYGLYPSNELKNSSYRLEQAMTFKTKISAIKEASEGDFISYGCTFEMKQDGMIATIPVGYADGFSRALSNQGEVLVDGTRVPIVGRICMDQSMVDVSFMNEVFVGEEVTVFGSSNKNFISIDEIAVQMGTINYEVVCLVGKRVPRVYIKDNDLFSFKNNLLEVEESEKVKSLSFI